MGGDEGLTFEMNDATRMKDPVEMKNSQLR